MDGKVKKNWLDDIINAFKPMQGDVGKESQIAMGLPATTVRPVSNPTVSNPTQVSSSELSRVMGGAGITPNTMTGFTPTTTRLTDAQRDAADMDMFNAMGGTTVSTPSTVTPVVQPVSTTSTVPTPRFTPGTSTTDWSSQLSGLAAQGRQLAGATRTAQQQIAERQYADQLRAIQTAARQQQLSEQQARQQIAEGAFTRERQLLEAASQRGLGGSGIEQLAQTQQRVATGQQINQLAQQTGLQREQLTNALSQAATQKGAALTQAETNYLTTALQINQAEFQQGLSLEDRQRANAYQQFQADLASANFTSSQDYIKWQKDNAVRQAELLGIKNKQDLLAILSDPNLSEDFKDAWIKLGIDGKIITDAEGKDWISKNLKTITPEEGTDTNTDYTSQLSAKAVNLILKGGETNWLGVQKPIVDKQEARNSVWSFKNADGVNVLLKGDAVLDKNNTQSPVYAFRDLPGYAVIEPDFNLAPGKVSIGFKYNGKGYDTFAKASEAYQLDQLRKG